jgi:hypothetical protein
VWPHRPQIRLPSTHFGLLIGAKSTLGALLIPLFGQFQGEVRRTLLLGTSVNKPHELHLHCRFIWDSLPSANVVLLVHPRVGKTE